MSDKTFSQEILDEYKKEVVVIDKAGRKIILKKPRLSKVQRFIGLTGDKVGRELKNILFFVSSAPVPYIYSIDDYIAPPLETQSEIDELYDILDDYGLEAVQQAYNENFSKIKSEEEMKEDIKKLQKTQQP
jgi:hypothetical protein